MSSGIIVAIKIKPYLKDYIIHKNGGSEPIKATSANKIFPMLSGYLTHKPNGWKHPEPANDILLFELPYNEVMDVRDYSYINESHFPEISNFFYGSFYTHFVTFMNKRTDDKGEFRWMYKYAIITFMDWFNISIDKVNYDSLKRIYQRYRKPFDDYDENKFNERFKQKNFPNSQRKTAPKASLLRP